MALFIVTAHLPREEKADRFEGPDALPPVDWVIGSKPFAEAKLKTWEKFYNFVALREVGEPIAYGAK